MAALIIRDNPKPSLRESFGKRRISTRVLAESVDEQDRAARHVDAADNVDVRLAALKGWARAAPEDRKLAGRLRDFTKDPNRNLQLSVIDLLGSLHRLEDVDFFRDLSGHPDATIAQAARDAAEGIEAFKVRSQP